EAAHRLRRPLRGGLLEKRSEQRFNFFDTLGSFTLVGGAERVIGGGERLADRLQPTLRTARRRDVSEPFDERVPSPTEGGQTLRALGFFDLDTKPGESTLRRGEAICRLGKALRLVELSAAIDVVTTGREPRITSGPLAETFGPR